MPKGGLLLRTLVLSLDPYMRGRMDARKSYAPVAIDHRAPGLADMLAAACPRGIDVYFENVGGAIWQAVLPLLNLYARVPVCGLISQYSGAANAPCEAKQAKGDLEPGQGSACFRSDSRPQRVMSSASRTTAPIQHYADLAPG